MQHRGAGGYRAAGVQPAARCASGRRPTPGNPAASSRAGARASCYWGCGIDGGWRCLMRARTIWGGRSVVAALACGAMLAGGGPAVAGVRPALAAGDISTVAGGVGGPAMATAVSLEACGVTFGNGHLYLAGSGTLRSVNPAGDGLTTPAGVGSGPAPLGDGGRATAAFFDACGVAVDT